MPVKEIQEGIRHGARKANMDTDIRLAMTRAMRRAMARDPEEFGPRAFLKEARKVARELCGDRFVAFGGAGQAPKIRPLSLAAMGARYRASTLAPVAG